MILKHLSILNYKNIRMAEVDFSAKLNCIFGLNGMGKTNFLDSIYYLSFCKSSNNLVDTQNIFHGEEFFMISGQYVDDKDTELNVSCGYKKKHRKVFKKNGKEYKRFSEHIGLIPLVMIAPFDSNLIAGGSEERRRFIDVVISQYDKEYLNALIRYEKAVTQRNSLLRMEVATDKEDYEIWEEMMSLYGRLIMERRRAFVEDFSVQFRKIYDYISGDSESVSLEYITQCDTDMKVMLRESRAKDLVMGYSLKGIHKDDLGMYIGGYPMKKEGSQGQNKTFLISLKLAQFFYLRKYSGTSPVLLLDDIFDKLDSNRVEKIIRLVSGEDFGQIFITDTDRERFEPVLAQLNNNYKVFRVTSGVIELQMNNGQGS